MGGPSRLSGSAFSIDEKGYIGLGYNFETDKDLKDFWEYNPTNNTWTQKTNFGGHARQGAASFAVEGKGYIGTGYDYDNDVDLKDFWRSILHPIHGFKSQNLEDQAGVCKSFHYQKQMFL